MSNTSEKSDKSLAAVCGLYCEACSLYIGTMEDPARLKKIAGMYNMSEEEAKCYGCRSSKRGPYCSICKMYDCAQSRGIDFCVECSKYPCVDLKNFQVERPHRAELFDDLAKIKSVGYKQWLKEIRNNYTCAKCSTINSGYDLKCRKCGEEPSCNFTAKHKTAIKQFLDQL